MSDAPEAESPREPTLDEPQFEVVPVDVFDTDPEQKPRHYVVGGELVSQTADGEVRLPLRVPFRLLGDLADKSPRDQLYAVLRDHATPRGRRLVRWFRRRPDLVQRIDELDYIDSGDIIRKFWQALGEKEQARLGESLRSIDSSRSTAPQSASTSATDSEPPSVT